MNIVSTSKWKSCVSCFAYRRHVWMVENVGPMCATCVGAAGDAVNWGHVGPMSATCVSATN